MYKSKDDIVNWLRNHAIVSDNGKGSNSAVYLTVDIMVGQSGGKAAYIHDVQ